MAKRASNRERIQRQAMEAEAKQQESEEKKAAAAKKPKSKAKKKAVKKAGPPLMMVWVVYDDRLKEVAVFPHREKDAADAKAAALRKDSGKHYFVNSDKRPMED